MQQGIKLINDFFTRNKIFLKNDLNISIKLYTYKFKFYYILQNEYGLDQEYDVDEELQKLFLLKQNVEKSQRFLLMNKVKLDLIIVTFLADHIDYYLYDQQQKTFAQAIEIIHNLRTLIDKENSNLLIEVENTFMYLCTKKACLQKLDDEVKKTVVTIRTIFNPQASSLEVSDNIPFESLYCQYLCITRDQENLQLAIANYEALLLKIGKKNDFLSGDKEIDTNYCKVLSLRHDCQALTTAKKVFASLNNYYPNFKDSISFTEISEQLHATQMILDENYDNMFFVDGLLLLNNANFFHFQQKIMICYKDNCNFNLLMAYYYLYHFLFIHVNPDNLELNEDLFITCTTSILNAIEYGIKESAFPITWQLLQHCVILYCLMPENIRISVFEKKYGKILDKKIAVIENIFPSMNIDGIFTKDFQPNLSRLFNERFCLLVKKLRDSDIK